MACFKHILLFLLLLCGSAAWGQRVYNITDYGAISDTTQLSTVAIQKAIDDCAAHGGGTVWVPAGNYLSGTVLLKSYVNLHLDAGATIYASRRIEDFSNFARKVGAADNAEAEMLIGAVNARDISITGQGMLNCRAVRTGYRREPKRKLQILLLHGRLSMPGVTEWIIKVSSERFHLARELSTLQDVPMSMSAIYK